MSIYVGKVKLDAGEEDVEGWRLDLEFSSPVDWLESAMAEASGAGPQWRLTSRSWDNNIPAGGHLDLKFLVDYSAARSEFSPPHQTEALVYAIQTTQNVSNYSRVHN